MQYKTMQCNANAMQCNATRCNAKRCKAMQCNAMQCNAIQCSTIQYNALQYNTLHICQDLLKQATVVISVRSITSIKLLTIIKGNSSAEFLTLTIINQQKCKQMRTVNCSAQSRDTVLSINENGESSAEGAHWAMEHKEVRQVTTI